MTTGVAPVNPKVQFLSPAGAPLANGTVTVYVAGGTTPTDTWTDYGLTSKNTNPITLDARGEAVIWLDPTVTYKFLLKNAGGSQQWVVDNITGAAPATTSASLAASGGSALVGFIQAGTGAVARTMQAKAREIVSIKDFKCDDDQQVQGDGAHADGTGINKAIAYCESVGTILWTPPGVYNHAGLTITRPIKWVGSVRGPIYGSQVGLTGSVFQFTETSGDALAIDASAMAAQGIAAELESLVFDGNKNIGGATGGGGINLIGDKTGETFYVSGSVFRNVHVREAKGDAWTITGTCFLNTWHDCSGVYSGGHGLTHDKGASGNPTNNNWFGGALNDNAQAGLNCNGGKMTMFGTNISQNAGGGVIQDGGYLILDECDFEQNTGTTITVTNSSGATGIHGGMIHKSPGTAAVVGISFGAGCAGNVVEDVLFANFDHVNDRFLAFPGGSMKRFTYRTQNCLAGAFPTSVWNSIESNPQKEKTQRGSITFAGAGVGIRTAVITFATPFELEYTVFAVTNGAGLDPAKAVVAIDYSTQALGTITAQMSVLDAGYGDVTARYVAIGR